MKITKYVFNGVEYNTHGLVTLNFEVQLSNIELFLKNIVKQKSKVRTKTTHCFYVENKIYTIYASSKSYRGKKITVKVSAWVMCDILKRLGLHDNSDVYDNIKIFRYDLMKTTFKKN